MVHTAPSNLIHLGPLPNHHADHKAKITVDDVSFWYGVKQALKHISPVATARVELSASYTIVIMTHNLQQAARIAQRTAFFHLDGSRALLNCRAKSATRLAAPNWRPPGRREQLRQINPGLDQRAYNLVDGDDRWMTRSDGKSLPCSTSIGS
jgi:hypothetical protein